MDADRQHHRAQRLSPGLLHRDHSAVAIQSRVRPGSQLLLVSVRSGLLSDRIDAAYDGLREGAHIPGTDTGGAICPGLTRSGGRVGWAVSLRVVLPFRPGSGASLQDPRPKDPDTASPQLPALRFLGRYCLHVAFPCS